MNPWLQYFKSPFPSTQGFSAYRSPGIIVHLPVVALFLLAGIFLCMGHAWLFFLIPFYFVTGLYLGRDLAIYAHYNPLILIAVLLGMIFVPNHADTIIKSIEAFTALHDGAYSFLLSAVLITGFYFYVRMWAIMTRKEQKEAEAGYPTPLHFAAEIGDVKRCEELLAGVHQINFEGMEGKTPLHLAATWGHTAVIALLLDRGADVNLKTQDKFESHRELTPLHYASENNRQEAVKLLLKRGANVNAQSFHQYTPLHIAALRGHLKTAKILINAGADINLTTTDNQSALSLADQFGYKELAAFLRKCGGK